MLKHHCVADYINYYKTIKVLCGRKARKEKYRNDNVNHLTIESADKSKQNEE